MRCKYVSVERNSLGVVTLKIMIYHIDNLVNNSQTFGMILRYLSNK